MSTRSNSVPARWPRFFFIVLSATFVGCAAKSQIDEPIAATISVTPMSADDILARSAESLEQLGSLSAVGVMQDRRRPQFLDAPVRVDLARDGRCRVQVGMDLVIVDGKKWWSHRPGSRDFRPHRCFTKAPIETATSLISDGALTLLPSLFFRGDGALERDDHGAFAGWRMDGIAWSSGRPCYTLERREQNNALPSVFRLYVDQESWLVRQWTLATVGPDATEQVLLDVTFQELVTGEQAPAKAFTLTPPSPIERPEEVQSASAM